MRRIHLRLTVQSDGTLKGIVGGYQPIDHLGVSPQLGGTGSASVAGIDCAGDYRTDECMGISTGIQLSGVPAFMNDTPDKSKVASGDEATLSPW